MYLITYMKIVVFDFDLTLTYEHTGGEPNIEDTLKYFNNCGNNGGKYLIEMLHFLQKIKVKVHVNTRGNKIMITNCLNDLGKKLGHNQIVGEGLLIESVLGAETSEEIGDPYGGKKFDEVFQEMIKIGIKSIDESSTVWAYKKKEILDQIWKKYNIEKSNIYFYDDTKVNIDCCQYFGYINSYLIGSSALDDTIRKIFNLQRDLSQ